MSAEPPPSDANGGYNPDDWINNDPNNNGAINEQYLAQNYLQFPLAQGSETLGDAIVGGALTVQGLSTFSGSVALAKWCHNGKWKFYN